MADIFEIKESIITLHIFEKHTMNNWKKITSLHEWKNLLPFFVVPKSLFLWWMLFLFFIFQPLWHALEKTIQSSTLLSLVKSWLTAAKFNVIRHKCFNGGELETITRNSYLRIRYFVAQNFPQSRSTCTNFNINPRSIKLCKDFVFWEHRVVIPLKKRNTVIIEEWRHFYFMAKDSLFYHENFASLFELTFAWFVPNFGTNPSAEVCHSVCMCVWTG